MPHDYKRALRGAGEPRRRRRTGLMGELGGFLRLQRVGFDKRDPRERVRDYRQYFSLPDDRSCASRAARCMDCGVPFCHEGCPLGNLIPDWNDLVYRDHWRDAIDQLHATNNFPEFTGLICPAPCESACVLDINDDPVTIEQIELAIVTRGFDEGWIVARPARGAHRPDGRSGRLGPGRPGGGRRAEQARPRGDGLRARRGPGRAAALRRARRQAREVDHRPARRRCSRRRASRSSAASTSAATSARPSCASATTRWSSRSARACIATSRSPGRELDGVHFAMDYLYQRNRAVARRRAARRRETPEQDVDHAPPASAWSSSAAATPAWTASPTRSARAPRTC